MFLFLLPFHFHFFCAIRFLVSFGSLIVFVCGLIWIEALTSKKVLPKTSLKKYTGRNMCRFYSTQHYRPKLCVAISIWFSFVFLPLLTEIISFLFCFSWITFRTEYYFIDILLEMKLSIFIGSLKWLMRKSLRNG